MSITIHIYAIICALIYAISYTIGGRDKAPIVRPRIWKRIIAPVLYASSIIIISFLYKKFSLWYLIAYPAYISAHFLLGYGGDTLWVKLVRRFLSGLVIGVSASSVAVPAHSYVFLGSQVFLAILAHMTLGILNPFSKMGEKGAWLEEGSIAFLTVILVPYMVM